MKNQPGSRRRGRLWIILLLLPAVLICVLPQFRLRDIHVEGQINLKPAEIIALSGLETGRHLFFGLGGSALHWQKLRYRQVEANLQDGSPVIQSVEARLSFPGSIVIRIEERIEVAYIAIPDGCVMIDKHAVAMRIDRHPPAGIPLIEGITSRAIVLGREITVDVPEALNSAVTLMGAIIDADRDSRAETRLLAAISKIRPISGRRLYLTLSLPDSGNELVVLVETGREQIEDMVWLRLALEQGVLENRGRGILDLTGGRRTFTPE